MKEYAGKGNAKCPFCNSKRIGLLRNIKSPINSKNYDHFSCRDCMLEFFLPLVFEDVYTCEKLDAYAEWHGSIREEYPPWTMEAVEFIRRQGLDTGNISVLDVGCGDCISYGALTHYLKIKSVNYYALDVDSKSLSICRKRGVKNTINGFFGPEATREMKSKFDIIVATEVLEHNTEPKKFFETAFGVLKKGGFLILTVPNRERLVINLRESQDLPPHHFLRFNKRFFIHNFGSRVKEVKDYPSPRKYRESCERLSRRLFKSNLPWPLFALPMFLLDAVDSLNNRNLFVALQQG
ncbi:MAG: class I SAM-dependent methyltransferase [Candidatus Micrarchaeota archaeon]